MKAKKFWILAILVVVSSLILGIVAGAQDDRQGASIPSFGPRGSVGPDVPLSKAEKKQFAKRVVVERRTPTAVQAACERAAKEGVRVVLLPAGQYVFEREAMVRYVQTMSQRLFARDNYGVLRDLLIITARNTRKYM